MAATLAEVDAREIKLRTDIDAAAAVLASNIATTAAADAQAALEAANSQVTADAAIATAALATANLSSQAAATAAANATAAEAAAQTAIDAAILAATYVPPPPALSKGTPFYQVLPTDGTSWATTTLAANTIPANKQALIQIFTRSATAAYTIDAVTYGGVSLGSPIAQDNVTAGQRINWYVAPLDLDGEVTFTTSATCVRAMVVVWPLQDLQSSVPVGTAGTASTSATVNLTVAEGGAAFGFANGTVLGTFTWTGLTEEYDGYIETNTNATSFGSALTAANGTLAVKALQTGSPTVFRMSCVSLR